MEFLMEKNDNKFFSPNFHALFHNKYHNSPSFKQE